MAFCPSCVSETGVMDGKCCVCGHDFASTDDSGNQSAGLVGDRTKRRYLAAIIDNVGAIVVSFLIAQQLTFVSPLVQGLSAYLIYLHYYFVTEGFFGTTLGKWFLGLAVVGVDGSRCTPGKAAIRTLLRIVELNPILFGAIPAILLILLTRRRQRLGGILTGTVVARVR